MIMGFPPLPCRRGAPPSGRCAPTPRSAPDSGRPPTRATTDRTRRPMLPVRPPRLPGRVLLLAVVAALPAPPPAAAQAPTNTYDFSTSTWSPAAPPTGGSSATVLELVNNTGTYFPAPALPLSAN